MNLLQLLCSQLRFILEGHLEQLCNCYEKVEEYPPWIFVFSHRYMN